MAQSKNKAPPPKAPLEGPAAPDLSILGDKVNVLPSGYTESINNRVSETHDHNLVADIARLRERPLEWFREISLHVQGRGWRAYENVVGQPVYYEGYTDMMKTAVSQSPILRAKITELVNKRLAVEESQGLFDKKDPAYDVKRGKRGLEIQKNLHEVADIMTDGLMAKMESRSFIRPAMYLVTFVVAAAYHQGIHVSSEEILRLRSVAAQAQQNKHSLIFLPSHRSHIDYLSLQSVCYRLNLALPIVVAGDNLNFPLVGPFLKNCGAMYIRRSFGDDQLYSTLVQAYMDTLLQKGYNFECFIEGTRSRIGKLLPPKFGILSFLMETVLTGRADDAIICPVSTQYDKVIEVDTYITELLGKPKKKESLADFLSASSVLSLKLGRVDCRFHAPWSLREFIQDQKTRFQNLSENNEVQLDYEKNLKIRLLRTLGYKVLSDINSVSVVMPTSLVGTVLLTLRGRGVGKSELVRRVEWIADRVRAQGGRVAHFAGIPTETVVARALQVLGPTMVGVQTDVVEETYFAVDRFQLSFYRNMTIHLFISQALVAASMYTHIKASVTPDQQAISYKDLKESVAFLSQLFRGEFIFATAGLTANLNETLRGLEADGVIQINRKPDSDVDDASNAEGIESVELSLQERAIGRENFDFYCFLIWPFIETAWLGAVSALALVPPKEVGHNPENPTWVTMKKTQDQAQQLGKTLFAQGDLSYFEAVNKETLKNTYTRMQEEGIIVVKRPTKEERGVPERVRLSEEWMMQRDENGELRIEGRLWQFCEEISRCRLEGKNRRDGDSAIGRVLRLIETVTAPVWETASTISPQTEAKMEDHETGIGKQRAPARPSARL